MGVDGGGPQSAETGANLIPIQTEKAAPKVIIPADAMPIGTGRKTGSITVEDNLSSPYADSNGLVNGQRIRGDEVIAPTDSRIPNTLYHATTNFPAVMDSEHLWPAGTGGLGGDTGDRVVSMTVSREIAEQLAEDMRFVGGLREATTEQILARLEAEAQHGGWSDEWKKTLDYILKEGGASDTGWLKNFFATRRKATGTKDPVFFDNGWRRIDPERVGIVEIPKENLNNGSLLVDFDLSSDYGLQEIRSYGEVAIAPQTTLSKAA